MVLYYYYVINNRSKKKTKQNVEKLTSKSILEKLLKYMLSKFSGAEALSQSAISAAHFSDLYTFMHEETDVIKLELCSK